MRVEPPDVRELAGGEAAGHGVRLLHERVVEPARPVRGRELRAVVEQPRLEAEFTQAGRASEFAALKPFLTADPASIAYADAARAIGLGEGAARVAVHRLRKRYRERFREEIAQTVVSAGEIDSELRHLLHALAAR